jgi:hypothetical protein
VDSNGKDVVDSSPVIEYNFAKKAEQLFGVKLYNRYLFSLDY